MFGKIVCCKMADALPKSGLFFDELSKIRVLEPEVAQETNELKEECRDFVESKYRKSRAVVTKLFQLVERLYHDALPDMKNFYGIIQTLYNINKREIYYGGRISINNYY
jgi:intraflagellar transport protein 20